MISPIIYDKKQLVFLAVVCKYEDIFYGEKEKNYGTCKGTARDF